jgi:hypothetical protein
MSCYLLVSSCLLLVQGQAPASDYVLQITPAKRIEAVLTLNVRAPDLNASEWILFAPNLPEVPGQRKLSSVMKPEGKVVTELSPLQRALLMARVPVRKKEFADSITVEVKYEAELLARHLVRKGSGVKGAPAPGLSVAERKSALAATRYFDYDSAAFKKWLKETGLTRGKDESEVDYARRVFLKVTRGFKYLYGDKMDRRATAVCQAGKSDCGGLCVVFASALRAHGIPARLLVGRWAISSKPNEVAGEVAFYQQHVKAEFYARGLGWVPVDLSSAILHDKSPSGLRFFGHDPGDFVVMHVDPELLVDTVHFGKQAVDWLQGPAYWVSGGGSLKGSKTTEEWQVKVVR